MVLRPKFQDMVTCRSSQQAETDEPFGKIFAWLTALVLTATMCQKYVSFKLGCNVIHIVAYISTSSVSSILSYCDGRLYLYYIELLMNIEDYRIV